MLGALFSYSAIRTKTSAMRARHLTAEAYSALMNKTSVAEACSYLKHHTVYRDIFSGYNERELHRGQIEQLLDHYLQTEVSKLYQFCAPPARKLLSYTCIRYEAEQLKRKIRSIFSGIPVEYAAKDDDFFARKSQLNFHQIFSCSSAGELLICLKGTPYYDILYPVLTSAFDLYSAEQTLDSYYFKQIWKLKDRVLSGKDTKIAAYAFGTDIDMLNLIWIFRQKKYYQLEGARIISSIIPIHYLLPRDTLMKLAYSSDISQFLNLAEKTPYARLFTGEAHTFIEQAYYDLSYQLTQSLVLKNPYSIACVIGYVTFLMHEIHRLITVIEKIRYGVT